MTDNTIASEYYSTNLIFRSFSKSYFAKLDSVKTVSLTVCKCFLTMFRYLEIIIHLSKKRNYLQLFFEDYPDSDVNILDF